MKPLTNRTILLTSGPTYAFIDAVRVISNRSSGRLGSTIASTLVQSGAHVIQLSGELSVSARDMYSNTDTSLLEVHRYGTVEQLKDLMQHQIKVHAPDAVIMAAAVLDYIPEQQEMGKKRSDADEWTVRFKRGEKLIEQIRRWDSRTLIVGFKLETNLTLEALTQRAEDLIKRSDAALVVANRLEEIDESRHVAYIMERSGSEIRISEPLNTREEIARMLTQRLAERLV
jgi:phosphopantothenoylcysteine synthetase/decarboxylase